MGQFVRAFPDTTPHIRGGRDTGRIHDFRTFLVGKRTLNLKIKGLSQLPNIGGCILQKILQPFE